MSENWNSLKLQIEFITTSFPHEAMAFADRHREEVSPYLLDALTQVANNPALAINEECVLHLYAMHMLAAWRDTRAYAAMVQLGAHDEEVTELLLGDTVSESYGRCIASVSTCDVAPIHSLIENTQISVWSRLAAIEALATMVFEGDYSRDEFIQYLQKQGALEAARLRQSDAAPEYFEVLNGIVSAANKLAAVEMQEQLIGWFDDNLIDATFTDKAWTLKQLATPFETHRDRELRSGQGYVNDVASEMIWWSAFADHGSEKKTMAYSKAEPIMPFMRTGAKIGRNDPCTCGSGKKYKKCHGASAADESTTRFTA